MRDIIKSIAVIFAGGVGNRMRSKDIPKQFLVIHDKPIIIHTLEHFQRCKDIDAIVIACVEDYIEKMRRLTETYGINKVKRIVAGGITGQQSIYNGLVAAKEISSDSNPVVLIHDGVRPLINEKVISENIESVKQYGSCITAGIVKETIVEIDDDGNILNVPQRKNSRVAKAPQSFYLDDILSAHQKAMSENRFDFILNTAEYFFCLLLVANAGNNARLRTIAYYIIYKRLAYKPRRACDKNLFSVKPSVIHYSPSPYI